MSIDAVSTTADNAEAIPAGRIGAVDRGFRRLFHRHLQSLAGGTIIVRDAEGEFRVGADTDLVAEVEILDPGFYRAAALGGTLGVAETYLDGKWRARDLTDVFRVFARNQVQKNLLETYGTIFSGAMERIRHLGRRNTRDGSRRNISDHYDLSNEFFALWLDPTMTYSAGIFATPETTMEEASLAKIDTACSKLDLGPNDHLLEIGTGWGGFAVRAAETTGCRVTTTTISKRQHEWASRLVRERGLEDRIEVLLSDYRDLDGTYDKIVSIEMIEAVGAEYWDTYFSSFSRLLADDGLALIQAITIDDRVFERARRSVDFIKRYVFPGCCIPSLCALNDSVRRSSDLSIVDVEDIGPHYAETLRRWREDFVARGDEVRAMGFDDRFMRLWEYYLRYCEAGFEERFLSDYQILYRRPGNRTAPVPERLGARGLRS